MPYMESFDSIVTATKKNNRYYGPTESQKMASFLSEIKADFRTIFNEINSIKDNLEVLASGYLMPSELSDSMDSIKRKIYNLEEQVEAKIFTEGENT